MSFSWNILLLRLVLIGCAEARGGGVECFALEGDPAFCTIQSVLIPTLTWMVTPFKNRALTLPVQTPAGLASPHRLVSIISIVTHVCRGCHLTFFARLLSALFPFINVHPAVSHLPDIYLDNTNPFSGSNLIQEETSQRDGNASTSHTYDDKIVS